MIEADTENPKGKLGAPFGNTNASKKRRLLADTLIRELTQNPQDAVEIVTKLITCAKAGESWAQQLVWERTDGKVAVSVVGGDDDDNPLRHAHVVEWVSGVAPATK
jgi:hypothetical protein